MKRLIILIVLLFPLAAYAGKPDFETGAGYPFGMNKSGMDKVKDAYAVHFDGNFRLTFNPIAIGFRLGYSQFRREEQWRDPKYQSLMGLATGSYLFSRNSAVSPFVRAGAGITFSNDRGGIFNDGFKTNFCFMPSVGVVFVRRIALSADDAFISKKYSHAAVRLGFRF